VMIVVVGHLTWVLAKMAFPPISTEQRHAAGFILYSKASKVRQP
jgi:hypothetical protein